MKNPVIKHEKASAVLASSSSNLQCIRFPHQQKRVSVITLQGRVAFCTYTSEGCWCQKPLCALHVGLFMVKKE